MSIRLTIEQESVSYVDGKPGANEFKSTHTIVVPDNKTLAAVMRGIADQLDPPKVVSSY